MPFYLGKAISRRGRLEVLIRSALGKALFWLVKRVFFFSTSFVLQTALLTHFFLYIDMAGSRNKFAEAARAAKKHKVVAGATAPPPKRARRSEEIIMLPTPPTTEESAPIQPESSIRDIPYAAPTQIDASARRSWCWSHIALGYLAPGIGSNSFHFPSRGAVYLF